MSDYASPHEKGETVARKASASVVGWIVLASLLCGAGVFLLVYFITFFAWWSFSGAALVVVGFLLFLRTWTGPESA